MSVAVQTEVGQSAKRKEISPWEKRTTADRKKPRQEELTYAEACGRNRENVESEDEWTMVGRRRRIRIV